MFDLYRSIRGRTMTSGHFRSNVWDPCLIVAQIVSMQCFFYVSLGVWICVVDAKWTGNFDKSMDQIFCPGKYSGFGIMIAFAFNSLTCSLGTWFIVQRTKQCLDFSATVYMVHLVICTLYSSRLPLTFSWWIMNIVCLTLTTVLSEFLCMRTEMRAIPLNSTPRVDL